MIQRDRGSKGVSVCVRGRGREKERSREISEERATEILDQKKDALPLALSRSLALCRSLARSLALSCSVLRSLS